MSAPGSNGETSRLYFKTPTGAATKYDILDANPLMSKRTIERVLKKFQVEGFVATTGEHD